MDSFFDKQINSKLVRKPDEFLNGAFGSIEHGCEFAPVAGIDCIFFEILSVPCRLYAVFKVKDVDCARQ